jgi:hypothetical protein
MGNALNSRTRRLMISPARIAFFNHSGGSNMSPETVVAGSAERVDSYVQNSDRPNADSTISLWTLGMVSFFANTNLTTLEPMGLAASRRLESGLQLTGMA